MNSSSWQLLCGGEIEFLCTQPFLLSFAQLTHTRIYRHTLKTKIIFRKMGLDWEVWKWALESGDASQWRQDMHFNSLIHYCKKKCPLNWSLQSLLRLEAISRNSFFQFLQKYTSLFVEFDPINFASESIHK